ncbi:MAG: 6-phosphogluconolactonase [Thermoanaerobaculia bacterium]
MNGGEGRGKFVVLPDPDALAREAAEDFTRRALDAAARGRFTVALSGGHTPRRLYSLLGDERAPYRARVPWERVHLFWGDERHVGPDDPRSNYRMVREALLSRVAIPESNVHRIPAELTDAAARYEAELRRFFALAPGEIPRFDLMYLGLGTDGHTASLFPETTALSVRDRLVVATWVAKLNAFRITMTYPVFEEARAVVFLVAGADKAEVLSAVRDPARAAAHPAGRIHPRDGELLWLVDRAAVGLAAAT